MKKTINDLIQLQQLIQARDEQSAAEKSGRLKELNKAIEAISADIPPKYIKHFSNLQARGQAAIVPISHNACTGCGLALPISLTHKVSGAKEIHTCPNCTRILYTPPKDLPTRIAEPSSRFAPPKIGISRFSAESLMLPNIKADGRETALATICNHMQETGFINDGVNLTERALQRESIVSTAVDHGIAFPHVRGVEGGGLALALATSKKGFHFDPDSRRLTRIIFFVSIPTAASAFYLKLIAGLSQTFSQEKYREKLLECKDQEDLWKQINHLTRKTIT